MSKSDQFVQILIDPKYQSILALTRDGRIYRQDDRTGRWIRMNTDTLFECRDDADADYRRELDARKAAQETAKPST